MKGDINVKIDLLNKCRNVGGCIVFFNRVCREIISSKASVGQDPLIDYILWINVLRVRET